VHVNSGDADVALLKVPLPVPPVTAHLKLTSELAPPPSMPWAESSIILPTSTDEGLAEREEMAAHTLETVTLPPMLTEPMDPASTPVFSQTTFTATLVVELAVMPKVADPAQPRPLDVVALSVTV
jgi:hypothetical protein